jgi:hypothetical protein
MNYLERKLKKQRQYLYEILESKPNGKASAKMAQNLRIDDDVIGKRGDITIIQNQSMHLVVNNVAKALQISDDMLFEKGEPASLDLDQCIYELYKQGLTAHQIHKLVKNRLYEIAIFDCGTKTKAARRLGISSRAIRYEQSKGGYPENKNP